MPTQIVFYNSPWRYTAGWFQDEQEARTYISLKWSSQHRKLGYSYGFLTVEDDDTTKPMYQVDFRVADWSPDPFPWHAAFACGQSSQRHNRCAFVV